MRCDVCILHLIWCQFFLLTHVTILFSLAAALTRCKAVLSAHRRELEIVAKGLLEYESLAGSEIVDLINGKALGSGVRSQRPSRATKPLPGALPVVSSNTNSNASNASSNTSSNTSSTTSTGTSAETKK